MPRPTPAGVTLAFAGIVLTIVGMASGVRELMLVGSVAVAATIWDAIWIGIFARQGTLQIHFPGNPPISGAPIATDVTLSNNSRRTLLPTILTFAVGPTTVLEVPFVSVSKNSRQQLRLLLPPQTRGWLDLRAVRSNTTGPLGLAQKRATVSEPFRILVRPIAELIPSVVGHEGDLDDSVSDVPVTFSRQEDEFAEVREFLPGDEVRRVHWPTTARAGSPAVREFERVGGGRVCVYCDPGTASTDAADRERAIRAAASITASCLLIGTSVELAIGNQPQVTLSANGGSVNSGSVNSGAEDALDELALAEPRPVDDNVGARFNLERLNATTATALFVCTPSSDFGTVALTYSDHRSSTVICTDKSQAATTSEGWISYTDESPFANVWNAHVGVSAVGQGSTNG